MSTKYFPTQEVEEDKEQDTDPAPEAKEPEAAPAIEPESEPKSDAAPGKDISVLPAWAQKMFSDLHRENASHRQEKKKAEKAAEDANRRAKEEQGEYKALYEGEKARADQLEQEIKDADIAALRARIGVKYKLEQVFIDVLHGESEEDIEQHARQIVAALPKKPATADVSAGANTKSNGVKPADQVRQGKRSDREYNTL